MSIKQKKEIYIHVDEDNTIIELKESYLAGSVIANVIDNTNTITRSLLITEIGQKYIKIDGVLSINEKVSVEYSITSISEGEDLNVLDRLNKIEFTLNEQNKVIDTLIKAMNNRVDKHTFNVWLKAVEHRFGKPILEHNLLGVQAVHIGDLD